MTTAQDIKLVDIADGDEVIIRDQWGNKAQGKAHLTADHRGLYLLAFGTRVEFARRTAAGWQHSNHIKVVGHQEPLFR